MARRSKSSRKSRPWCRSAADVVKQQVAAHWDRRAPTFDEDFGHSIRTPDERAAWDRILDLVLAGRAGLDALDVGCGTGFLAFELTARGHRVTGVDFAPAMIAQARRKAAELGVTVRFEEADVEQLPFAPGTFDLVISRHVLWTLPHPEAAIDEWIRVLRPAGRLVVVDSHFGRARRAPGVGECPHEPGIRGDRRSAAIPRRPLPRADRGAAGDSWARACGQRSPARPRRSSGATADRRRSRAADASALRRVGRRRALMPVRSHRRR